MVSQRFALLVLFIALSMPLTGCRPEPTAEEVARSFLEELTRGSFNPQIINTGEPGQWCDLGDGWTRRFLSAIPEYDARVCEVVQSRLERYQGLEITEITLEEVTRRPATPAERAYGMGERVTYHITWAAGYPGQGWEDREEGYIVMLWVAPDYAAGSHWRVLDLSP